MVTTIQPGDRGLAWLTIAGATLTPVAWLLVDVVEIGGDPATLFASVSIVVICLLSPYVLAAAIASRTTSRRCLTVATTAITAIAVAPWVALLALDHVDEPRIVLVVFPIAPAIALATAWAVTVYVD